MHEEYIAPFDSPIYKSEEEVIAERDSILKEFKPYFLFDIDVVNGQLERFGLAFEERWASYLQETGVEGERLIQRMDPVKEDYAFFANDILRFVYNKGIIGTEDILERVNNKDLTIVIVQNQYAEERNYEEVFTQRRAYEYVLGKVTAFTDSLYRKEDVAFFRSLNLNEFLMPNLFYDDVTSTRVRNELIEQISLTRGMVQAGQRIISRGELVSTEKFRILESLKLGYERNLGFSGQVNYIVLGKIILVVISMIILYLFLYNFRKEVLQSSRETIFILLMVLIMAAISSVTLRYDVFNLYILPFAIVPIMIRTFFDARLALYVHLIILLVVGFWAPNSFEFIFLNLIAGIVAIFSLTNSYKRGILFLSAMLIVITYSTVYFAFSLIQEGNLATIDYKVFPWFAGNGLLILSVYPLIFIFEKTFKFLSDATLIELSDTNQPLLRELTEKAPGTFQHSLQVSNLAEEAIFQIGGNPLLVRTGALYHDIGKMSNPLYFIENQSSDYNPHDEVEFEESARIIIHHVIEGIEIAKKHSLPEPIINFIRTHHGTTLVQYFYRSFLKKFPENEADLNKFTYPGPKPFSREMAVLMMADSIEAASRSLKVRDEKSLKNLVDLIIEHQITEKQFDNTDITFRDIRQVKEIFLRKLLTIYHVRIEYPQ